MPYPQIRINKTKELAAVLQALKKDFRVLSEAEIIKLSLAELLKRRVLRSNPSFKRRLMAAYSFGFTTKDNEPDNFDPKKLKPINYADFL